MDAFGGINTSREPRDRIRVLERLRAGQIIAVARSASLGSKPPISLWRIRQSTWIGWDGEYDDNFWDDGDASFSVPADGGIEGYSFTTLRCFDIRFDPATFSGRPPPSVPPDGSPRTVIVPEIADESDEGEPLKPERDKEISKDDATRFSRAVLAGWPDATEKFAHEKALAFFPNRKVPRDWFLRIFRSIRGPKSRGVQPRTRN